MDTKALEKFCPWARAELIGAVARRCARYGLDDAGRAAAGPGSDVVGGRVLSAAERAQRAALYGRVEAEGWDAFCEREAYGWFNRLVAIRYMEVRGFLPCRVRVLSAQDGSFDPECLRALGELGLPGLDVPAALGLSVGGRAEDAYRMVLVAQCNQLADALPDVFGHVGDADALTLPDGLLRSGEHDVLYHLVADVPEGAWADVEALGWAYQFYNSERKAEFFGSKRKAAPEDIAPATQLFTPEWIVRYMVENSLGRLWMLNHPESRLRERMGYYVEPGAGAEDFIRITSPEEITVCDPACGSGHILSYAFELLMAMYEESGYRERDAASLILERNLSGMEIDPRAAQIASLVLAMRAREHDRRFLTREGAPRADVTVLSDVPLEEGDLTLCGSKLPEALRHLGEVGSLLAPTEGDLASLRAELGGCQADLLGSGRAARVADALRKCEALSRRFDVVVANPPYMGSSSFNEFMSKWVKANYPDTKADLCTCFVERGFNLARERGYVAMITASSWMFISSFRAMREKIVENVRITSMIQQSTHGFPFVTVPTTMFVMQPGVSSRMGTYIRLEDFDRPQWQQPKALEAIQNPGCGWLYRRDAQTFTQIPGTPIAYWASEGLIAGFSQMPTLADLARPRQGLATGDNNRFLRSWWEVAPTTSAILDSEAPKWYPCNKGGGFRKWYGNNEVVINWENNGAELKAFKGSVIRNPDYYLREGITWGTISSSNLSMRYSPEGFMFESKGGMCFADSHKSLMIALAFTNSAIAMRYLTILCPTLDFHEGPIGKLPLAEEPVSHVVDLTELNVALSKADWDSFETSWDFKRHPLL
ncbi:BREX-1 system adenine-specific DNA-methyltransferase PglX [Paratractidigestivibacter sp.]|uniref:BREX-1 system adenine-specific DNA-methyltransferase PglX n=1 Tax=Paratractidigestivibacter sp. TaxID=2847316 RepID=UPI002ABD1E0A|nr:BREX-1 system adenine-specific DNA-methyltransferase PglX [Paratractidigestivibacter sp.]